MTEHGTYETIDGRPALCFERRLAHPVVRVWTAITDPADLAQWFPDGFVPDPSAIITSDAPRQLTFSWYTNELRFELEQDGDGTRLKLIALLDDAQAASRDAAGWHVCLDRLEQALATGDATAPDSTPTPEWSGLYEAYQARGFPAGAEIPSAG